MTSTNLRWYQNEAAEACGKDLETGQRALAVLATGLGKTRVISHVAKEHLSQGGRRSVLCLAHRDELVFQLREELERYVGESVGVEKADSVSSPYQRVVVGSIQSFNQRRLERLGRDRFSLVVIDEAHHATSPQYQKLISWFELARLFGVTATPFRADKVSLSRVFSGVSYSMGIRDGIESGYLVPIRCWSVRLNDINLVGLSKSGDDFSPGRLDERMVKAVEGIVRETIRLGGDRQGICFFAGTKSAEFAYERFNAIAPGSAVYVDAKTPRAERHDSVSRFRSGDARYLCNVGIANEGFDAPSASLVVHGAPTLSLTVYTQRIGRGTRPQPGVVDKHSGKDAFEARRLAIASSGKKDLLVLDFVGNCGKHTLMSPVDVLGEDLYSEDEKKEAKKRALSQPNTDARQLLEEARAHLQRIAKTLQSTTKSEVREVDPFNPFNVLHLSHDKTTLPANYKPASPGQISYLEKSGIERAFINGLDFQSSQRLVRAISARGAIGLASFRQVSTLQRFGVDRINIRREVASEALDYIASTEWGKRTPVSKTIINDILDGKRK